MCRRYQAKVQTPTFKVANLKLLLGLVDEQDQQLRRGFTSFRKHVMEVATAQINASTNLRIDCHLQKHGRAIFYLTFSVESQTLPGLLPAAG